MTALETCRKLVQPSEYAYEYGSYPPPNPDSVTNKLWHRYMKPWKPDSGNVALGMTKEQEDEIVKKVRSIVDAVDAETAARSRDA